MNNLLNEKDNLEIEERFNKLTPGKLPLWGVMNASQMLGHCCAGLKISLGIIVPETNIFMRLLGKMLKKKIIYAEIFRKNSPTSKEFIMPKDADFNSGKNNLSELLGVYRKAETKDLLSGLMHPFFGKLSSDEWGMLMYKHLDHHLRQFGL